MTHRFATVALLALVGLPAAAQQACPTAADLQRGIRIEFADGGIETYRQTGPGIVDVAGTEADGTGFNMSLARGLHLLMWEEVSGGQVNPTSRITYDYGTPPPDLPLPRPGKGWTSEVTAVDAVTGARDEPQTHRYGSLSSVTIGACSYAMLEVDIAYATPDHYREMLRWLPDLGLAYLIWNETDSLARSPVEATRIARVGK